MPRSVFFCLLIAMLTAGLASADEEAVVLKVDRTLGSGELRYLGFQYLADLGDAYMVQGDDPAVARLEQTGTGFVELVRVYPGDEIYLLKPSGPDADAIYSEALIEVAPGIYLTTARTHRMDELILPAFYRVRLRPGAFPEAKGPSLLMSPMAITPKPEIQDIITNVSGDTLWRYISQLSGREPAEVGGHLVSIPTRYSYNALVDTAARYIYERFEAYGIDVDYHYYTVGKYSFYTTCFVDSLNGWVAGTSQRIFRTRDGGLTWYRQNPGSPLTDWWGICFTDTLNGWVAGFGGKIYHTTDGGASWVAQASGTGVTLREVEFLDPLNGWIAGYSGIILRTTDGGDTWTTETTGTTDDIYGLHFQSATRGWASGENGTILFWDGASWSAQTSGSSEYFLDIHFGDDDTGWVVGGGATILRTGDGGSTWVPQTAPAGIDPYLKGVCFVDTLSGWAVGLSGTIIHTSDGGATWQEQVSGTLFGMRWVHFVNMSEGWAAGYGGTIHHTADGGSTWESQRENLPEGAILSWKNVVATKPGTSSTDQVIICGHFDSISENPNSLAPGADDNATGTVAVLEAARLLADYPFEKTIRFLCVSGEEQGLFGSGEYATDAKFGGEVITAVLNFDMIGYVNSTPEDIDLIGDYASEWLVDFTVDCMNAYVPSLPTLKVINPNEVYSDHASFWRAGYHALEAIEDDNLTYPYYHTTNDTLGNLTQAFTVEVVKGAVATLAELAVPDLDSGVTGNDDIADLTRARPNPFMRATTLSFALGSASRVEAVIYDVKGRAVRRLRRGMLPAGRHDLVWDGADDEGGRVSPGIYFINVRTDEDEAAAKVILLR